MAGWGRTVVVAWRVVVALCGASHEALVRSRRWCASHIAASASADETRERGGCLARREVRSRRCLRSGRWQRERGKQGVVGESASPSARALSVRWRAPRCAGARWGSEVREGGTGGGRGVEEAGRVCVRGGGGRRWCAFGECCCLRGETQKASFGMRNRGCGRGEGKGLSGIGGESCGDLVGGNVLLGVCI